MAAPDYALIAALERFAEAIRALESGALPPSDGGGGGSTPDPPSGGPPPGGDPASPSALPLLIGIGAATLFLTRKR